MNPYERAQAKARAVGDQSMKSGGRTTWNTADWNAYLAEYDKLYPEARREAEQIRQGRAPTSP